MSQLSKETKDKLFKFSLKFFNLIHFLKKICIVFFLVLIILGLFKLSLIPLVLYVVFYLIAKPEKKNNDSKIDYKPT